MNRARIIFAPVPWLGLVVTIVSRTRCGRAWIRPDEWPVGEPDPVGRGEMWFDEMEFKVTQPAAQAA